MLLIIDNQSSFIKRFRNEWLDERDIAHLCFDHNQPLHLKSPEDVRGIILSGGKGNPYAPLNLTTDYLALMQFDVPVLGLCLGCEILTVAYGGRIKRLPEYQNHREEIQIIDRDDPIFAGVTDDVIYLREKHQFYVAEIPSTFKTLGRSSVCPHEIIRHKTKPLYGFQSHPEVSGDVGIRLVQNFFSLCGIVC